MKLRIIMYHKLLVCSFWSLKFAAFYYRSPVDAKPVEYEADDAVQPIIQRHNLGTTTITASVVDGPANYGMWHT